MNSEFSDIAVWLGYGVCAAAVLYFAITQLKKLDFGLGTSHKPEKAKPVRVVKNTGGLKSDIMQEGKGDGAKSLDTLTVHFDAFLASGEKIDSSHDRGHPLTFKLGTGAVIYGWDQALKGVRAGEKRKVTVPAAMAYGKKGKNKVPPNASVIFEVEVLNIQKH